MPHLTGFRQLFRTMMSDMKKALTVDEYLADVAEPAHSALQKLREIIGAAAPKEATEAISYGMPSFKYKGALVAYAAFKDHCSFFPMNGAMVERFQVARCSGTWARWLLVLRARGN